jgi:GH15 family glucan-1,4-alpha-glucosidase
MSEQFNQNNGIMQGAVDLTWSHNAFMTAMMRCNFLKK